MIRLFTYCLAAAVASSPSVVHADPILDWNEQALSQVLAAKQLPPDGTRTMALVHVAMFNAVNAIEPRYEAYKSNVQAPPGASANAAAISAAHTVLVKLFPDQSATIDEAYAIALQRLAGQCGTDAGIVLGTTVANQCLAAQADDKLTSKNDYRPIARPGRYVPTPLPVSFEWRAAKPWVMRTPWQFRPEPPPALSSATWARDYREIRDLGAKNSDKRTSEQTETARFWTAVGAATWNPIVRALVGTREGSLLENARLFALVYVAASDAFIAVFDGKYAFDFWRPITAIRNGDIDGNEATLLDPAWQPLVETPLHPEYPCAHCITASAVASVLEAEFGADQVPWIAMTSPTAPGVTHRWNRLTDYVKEVGNARIWGGIHYRNSTEVGENMGRAIGRLTLTSVLRPVR